MFVIRFDNNGNFLEAQAAGGAGFSSTVGVASNPSGEVVLVGNYLESAQFGAKVAPKIGSQNFFVAVLNAANSTPTPTPTPTPDTDADPDPDPDADANPDTHADPDTRASGVPGRASHDDEGQEEKGPRIRPHLQRGARFA